MNCPKCNSSLSFKSSRCDRCGEDLSIYRKALSISNQFYNEGLAKAKVRDLSGAILVLKKSLQMDKRNTNARNLLGLVYYEMGETVSALSEWVISKHYQKKENDADVYMNLVQANPSKLHTINQTIKKYNYALMQAKQGSLDLAIIQLKKVIALNPKYICAYQLLALLYVEQGEEERAIRYLRKAKRIDVSNTTTLRYLAQLGVVGDVVKHERENAKTKESGKSVAIERSEDTKYFAPVNAYQEDKPNIWAFINLIIGVVIGFLVVFFLVVPTMEKKIASKYNNDVVSWNEEQASIESQMTTLQNEKEDLEKQVKNLEKQIADYKGKQLDEKVYSNFFKAVELYIDGKKEEAAKKLVTVEEDAVEISSAKSLYKKIKEETFAVVARKLYQEGNKVYNRGKYEEAIDLLKEALTFEETNTDAMYFLGRCYHMKGDAKKAAEYYNKIIEDYPTSKRVAEAKRRLATLKLD